MSAISTAEPLVAWIHHEATRQAEGEALAFDLPDDIRNAVINLGDGMKLMLARGASLSQIQHAYADDLFRLRLVAIHWAGLDEIRRMMREDDVIVELSEDMPDYVQRAIRETLLIHAEIGKSIANRPDISNADASNIPDPETMSIAGMLAQVPDEHKAVREYLEYFLEGSVHYEILLILASLAGDDVSLSKRFPILERELYGEFENFAAGATVLSLWVNDQATPYKQRIASIAEMLVAMQRGPMHLTDEQKQRQRELQEAYDRLPLALGEPEDGYADDLY